MSSHFNSGITWHCTRLDIQYEWTSSLSSDRSWRCSTSRRRPGANVRSAAVWPKGQSVSHHQHSRGRFRLVQRSVLALVELSLCLVSSRSQWAGDEEITVSLSGAMGPGWIVQHCALWKNEIIHFVLSMRVFCLMVYGTTLAITTYTLWNVILCHSGGFNCVKMKMCLLLGYTWLCTFKPINILSLNITCCLISVSFW